MPNLVGIGNSQVPTNAMLGGLAYQDPKHAILSNVEPGNISKIKTIVRGDNDCTDTFVYNTANDSDGGAWRNRCHGTSWYNEPKGVFRGHRNEFPSLAVILTHNDNVFIYDGDDPNCPLWMKITHPVGDGSNTCICALNGILVIGASNNGILEYNFVSDKVRVRNHADLHTYNRGVYPLHISTVWNSYNYNTEDSGSGYGNPVIDNEIINDVDMIVEPDAAIDHATQLPIPTIGVATNAGINMIRGTDVYKHNVIRRDAVGSYHIKNVRFTKCGNYYYWNTDYSPSPGHANMLKRSLITQTGQLADFYSANEGVLAQQYWLIHRTDTAHDTVSEHWGFFPGAGNVLFNEVVTWDNNQAALSTNGQGITQWQLFRNPTLIPSNRIPQTVNRDGILCNHIKTTYNTGWMPNECLFNYICQTDSTVGAISNGATITSRGARENAATCWSNGGLTYATVATGAELRCISGFSGSNGAAAPTNGMKCSGFTEGFGSNAAGLRLTMMGWIKITDLADYSYLCSIRQSGNSHSAGLAIHRNTSSNDGQPYMWDSVASSVQSNSNWRINDGEWHHICGVWQGTTSKRLYVNGIQAGYSTSNLGLTLNAVDQVTVGSLYRGDYDYNCRGSLALVKFVAGCPSPAQINKIYSEEKELFQDNAKCSLAGSSDNMYGMDYDSSTGILHTGNNYGRSDFRKLIRINSHNKPLVLGSSHNIAAEGGLVAEQLTLS